MACAPEARGDEMANDGRMTLRGGPPPDGRAPVSLADYIHLERRRVLVLTAKRSQGYKHLVAKTLRLSRPQLDRYIRLYDIGAHFRLHRRYTPKPRRP